MVDAQETHIRDKSPRGPRPSEVRRGVKFRARRAEQRAAFAVAIRNGQTIAQASAAAGVSRNTGGAWAKRLRDDAAAAGEVSDVARRDEIARTLTNLIRDPDFPPAYKVNAITAYNRMMGNDAPTKSQVEVRQVPASVAAWLDAHADAIDVTPEPMLPSHGANAALPSSPRMLHAPAKSQEPNAETALRQADTPTATTRDPHGTT